MRNTQVLVVLWRLICLPRVNKIIGALTDGKLSTHLLRLTSLHV